MITDDQISRQAALEAIKTAELGCEYEAVKNLPSAQQDCSDCIKHGGDWDCDHVHCHKGESARPLVLTCDGCRHVGTYDTDFPCSGCIRREKDYYEQER